MEIITTKPGKIYRINPENNEKIKIPIIITTLTSTTELENTIDVIMFTTENLYNGL